MYLTVWYSLILSLKRLQQDMDYSDTTVVFLQNIIIL